MQTKRVAKEQFADLPPKELAARFKQILEQTQRRHTESARRLAVPHDDCCCSC